MRDKKENRSTLDIFKERRRGGREKKKRKEENGERR
jgi:hypothetical protein